MPDKRSDVEIVRDQITREVSNDAYNIAADVFRQPDPDITRVSNQQIDDRYRRAYQSGDRQYLISEAQRDPRQFLEATKRLGITMPQSQPSMQQPPLPRTAQSAVQLPELVVAAAPAAAPSMPPAPASPGDLAQVPGPAGQVLAQLLGQPALAAPQQPPLLGP